MNISVCIASYGLEHWSRLAQRRALVSAQREDPYEVLIGHDPEGTIGSSRNDLAEQATGDYLCFLDADDELANGFVAAMQKAHTPGEGRTLYTPAVSYFQARRRQRPLIFPECSLERGNWLVISTLIPRDLFHEVGGFRDYGDPPGSVGYEDWSLFARLVQAGAQIVKVPEAVLVAHVMPGSRNRSSNRRERLRWHWEIGRDVWPEIYNEEWRVANGL